MRVFFAGLLLGLLAFDIVVDSYDFCCSRAHASISCCADACGVHVAPEKVAHAVPVAESEKFLAHELLVHSAPPPKALLRPPCLSV